MPGAGRTRCTITRRSSGRALPQELGATVTTGQASRRGRVSRKGAERFQGEPAPLIEEFIKAYVAESPENRLSRIDDSPIFEEPLVGFASGDDPLFRDYKEIVGPFHLTPREVLGRSPSVAHRGYEKRVNDISVICWALPVAKKTRASNARRDTWPTLRWSDTKYYGERFNNSLRARLVSFLAEQGYHAVAPLLSPLYRMLFEQPWGWTSTWSERHALYAAGMGTFGLSDGFITERGVAMRCGSVVVNLSLPPTPRKYRSHTQNCPYFVDKSCGVCIDRCPAGAVTAAGHDKALCFKYLSEELSHVGETYGENPLACGLCQTATPCESRIPPAATRPN